jgi:hypothetical protein
MDEPYLNLMSSKLSPTSFPLPKSGTFITISSNNQLYELMQKHIATYPAPRQDNPASLIYNVEQQKGAPLSKAATCCNKQDSSSESCIEEDEDGLLISVGLGLGLHRFVGFSSSSSSDEVFPFLAIKQEIGDPVGTGCGAEILSNLVLCAPNADGQHGSDSEQALRRLCSRVWKESQAESAGSFKIFRFNPKHEYWYRESTVRARPLDSVVIPGETKEKLLGDLEEFLDKDTRAFYERHGIPYKRPYLLFGVPGAACGIFEIIISYPLGTFVWHVILQEPYVTYLNYNALFIILGIGADDIFVLVDAYKQASLQPPHISGSLETRFAWAYNRAASAMLSTSLTTCAAFAACASSPACCTGWRGCTRRSSPSGGAPGR